MQKSSKYKRGCLSFCLIEFTSVCRKVFFTFFVVFCCGCSDVTVAPPLSDDNVINSFSLLKEHNSSLPEDVILKIEGNFISGKVPFGVNIDSLIGSIETNADFIEVNGDRQSNGETPNNFRDTVTYEVFFESGNLNRYKVYIQNFTGLPIVYISTDDGEMITSKVNYVEGAINIYGTTNYKDLESRIRIRGRGNSTWTFPKKPYQIRFDDKEEVLGMAADKKWIFLANYSDKTLL